MNHRSMVRYVGAIILLCACRVHLVAQQASSSSSKAKAFPENRLVIGYTPALRDYVLQSQTASEKERAFATTYREAQISTKEQLLIRWQTALGDAFSPSDKEKSMIYREIGDLHLPDAPAKALESYAQASAYATSYDFRLQEGQAAAYVLLGQTERAEEAQHQARKTRKKMGAKYIRKTEEALYENQYRTAFVYNEYVLSADSTAGRAYYYRGLMLQKIGTLPDPVIAACHQAVRYLPKDSKIYVLRGSMYLLKKDTLSAVADMEKVLEIDSRNLEAHLSLGEIAIKQKDHTRALAHYKQALRVDRDNVDAYLNQGYIYHTSAKRMTTIDAQYSAYKATLNSYEQALIILESHIRHIQEGQRPRQFFRFDEGASVPEEVVYSTAKLSEELLKLVRTLRKKTKKLARKIRERELLGEQGSTE